jgi:hypothetical protein
METHKGGQKTIICGNEKSTSMANYVSVDLIIEIWNIQAETFIYFIVKYL